MGTEASQSGGVPTGTIIVAATVLATLAAAAFFGIPAWMEARQEQAVADLRTTAKQAVSKHLERLKKASPVLSACLNDRHGAQLRAAGFLRSVTTADDISCWTRSEKLVDGLREGGCATSYKTVLSYVSDWAPGTSRDVVRHGEIKLFVDGDSYPVSIDRAGDVYSIGVAGNIEAKHSAAQACSALAGMADELAGTPALPRQPVELDDNAIATDPSVAAAYNLAERAAQMAQAPMDVAAQAGPSGAASSTAP